MSKLLLTLMVALGFARSMEAEPAKQMMGPNDILFLMPTIAKDLPPLDPLDGPPAADSFLLHEDDWAQTEFLPKAMLPEIRRMLSELKTFAAQNRGGPGWRNLYVRELSRVPLMTGETSLEHLRSMLDARTGPVPLLNSVDGTARIRDGFTLEIGNNVHLYGYADKNGIPVIAASLGPNADEIRLTEAFMKLSASDNLVLVDWRQQMLLFATDDGGQIAVWRP